MFKPSIQVGGLSPATYTYNASYKSTNNSSSYTFSTADIGAADSSRIVAVGIMGEGGGSTISSVTIGGNGATEAAQIAYSDNVSGIYYLEVAAGTTADIVVNFTASQNRAGISVYSIYDAASATPEDTSTGSGTTSATATGLAWSADSVSIGVAAASNGGVSEWTGLTEDYDSEVESSAYLTSASEANTSAGSGSVVCTSGGNRTALTVAIWR